MNTTTACLLGILGVAALGIGGIVALEIARPGGDWNANVTTNIIAVCTMVIPVLIGILKSQANANALQRVECHAQVASTAAVVAASKAEEVEKVVKSQGT